jgi:hypothetical protein
VIWCGWTRVWVLSHKIDCPIASRKPGGQSSVATWTHCLTAVPFQLGNIKPGTFNPSLPLHPSLLSYVHTVSLSKYLCLYCINFGSKHRNHSIILGIFKPTATMSTRSLSRSPSLETCENGAGEQVTIFDASFVDAEKLPARLTRILESSDFTCQYKQGDWHLNAARKLSADDLTRLQL